MKLMLRAAIFAAGMAVAIARPAGGVELRLPVSLTSFGAAQNLSAYQTSAAGIAALARQGQAYTYTGDVYRTPATVLDAEYALQPPPRFAASMAITSKFAFDSGYDLDLAARFDNYAALKSPLIGTGDVMALANGGRYAGATMMPAPSVHVRLGAAMRDGRLDSFKFDPSARLGLPLAFDSSQSRSLLAGVSWDLSDWATLGVTGLHHEQDGTPFGVNGPALGRTQTNAMDVAAHFNLGNGWVTTASYSQGLTQLDQRNIAQIDSKAYSFAIAKHGLFGDDALGFSLSRPMEGLLDTGFDAVSASGNLPPAFIANSRLAGRKAETDLQLGYVTSFLNGVELQANAAYQMNYQGQTGATAVSLLSRAKIKF